ncbi:MAG: carboxypeptidase-like regulatory domain-containing protein [Bacteroidota bacterium]
MFLNFSRKNFLFFLLFIFFLPGHPGIAQTILKSGIQGIVLDNQTQSPLSGATVTILDTNSLVGAVTDTLGRFKLTHVKIGQYQLRVTFMGYAPFITEPLIVTSGKETMTTIFLEETTLNAPEVEIRAGYRKNEAINKMATVSVRSFSVDETFRFAGSYNDPARMVANFAGVTSGIDNRNDIIVRGNSPTGLQWRIDDMEIPNPNHFAAVGTTGGPVTVLNNNLVTNSDFFTGAFPAQYGNTLAGIFDLKMRNGNAEKHEYWFEIGWNGLEFGAEGPFSKNSRASFLVSYRYSPLQFLNLFNINIGIVPKYQDLNIKINIPTRKAGNFTITAIGGLSFIELFDSRKEQSKWLFPDYGEDLSNGSNLGVLGISHQIFLAKSLMWKNIIYLVASDTRTKIDTFNNIQQLPSPWAGERSTEIKYSFSSVLTKKFSSKNSLNGGIYWDFFQMSFADSIISKGAFIANTGSKENMQMMRGFTQWQHIFSEKFSSTQGLYGSWLSLNNSWSLEPRIGFDWNISKQHSINFGTGLYSQMQPRVIYFILSHLPCGKAIQPNLDLGFTRSAQIAFGYNYLLNKDLRFKTEIYYQYLFDIPVKASIPQYSLSNQGHEFFIDRQYADSLVNKGTGQNYGLECTFERFFRKNYYFLLSASVFNSKYNGYDDIARNSAFNVNYALNAAGGYEFIMGKRKWGVMSFGIKATWNGGSPYIPFDVTATVASGEPVYEWSQAYSQRFPEYKRFAFRFGIRRNLPGYNIEFFVDLQYRTSFTNISVQRIDPKTGEIRDFFTMAFFPMGTWRIQF